MLFFFIFLCIIIAKEGLYLKRTREITQIAMMIALATIFHMIEQLIPIPTPIPGYRLGLSNIIGLITLMKFGPRQMLFVNFMRVIFVGLLTGNIFSYVFWMSFSGVALSTLAAMILNHKSGLSLIGISVVSSVLHCCGQILIAMVIYKQLLMASFLPFLLFTSIPTGIMTGTISNMTLKRLK